MKIEKKEIAAKLKNLGKVFDSRLIAQEGVLVRGNTLFAGNRSMGIRTTLSIPASDETFVIPKSAIGFIDSLPSGEVEITGDEKSVLIKCEKIKNKVATFNASLIAEPKIEDTAEAVTFDGEQLTDALRSVLYAAADNSQREILNGVLLDAADGKLNLVGCDGYRMAWNTLDFDDNFKAVIPKQVAARIVSLELSGRVEVTCGKTLVCFKDAEYAFYSHTMSGEYIKYADMYSVQPHETVINRKPLIDALKRALLCSADTLHNTVKLDFSENTLTVSLARGKSEFEEVIELDEAAAEPLEIGFNGKYLIEAIKEMDDDKITVEMGTNRQPFIINGGGVRALILPISLEG